MPQFSTPALNWLASILEERFGFAFTLQPYQAGLKLSLTDCEQGFILFPSLNSAFHESHSDLPHSEWDAAKAGWLSVLEQPLPAPGVRELPQPLIEQAADHYVVHYDVLGLTYWMLNRIEEIGRTDLDNHGRFPAIHSHAYKHGYLERPVVDEWLHVLGQVIQKQWPQVELKQHEFSMKVSHDVDAPSRYGFGSAKSIFKSMAGDVLKRRDIKSAITAPWVRFNSAEKLHSADRFNTFDWLMDVSEANNLTSAFYFICGRTSKLDASYEPEHPAIRELMRRMHQRGHEIGLHPSYNTYQKPQLIKQEADRLRAVLQEEGIKQNEFGGRMHYLRWEHPATLQAWNDAGMSYDSTLSYADRPGFRCGTCFEYPGFNTVKQEILSVRVRPLIVMECSIMSKAYLGLGNGNATLQKIKDLKENCKAVEGCFTLLWHNSEFLVDENFFIYSSVLNEN